MVAVRWCLRWLPATTSGTPIRSEPSSSGTHIVNPSVLSSFSAEDHHAERTSGQRAVNGDRLPVRRRSARQRTRCSWSTRLMTNAAASTMGAARIAISR